MIDMSSDNNKDDMAKDSKHMAHNESHGGKAETEIEAETETAAEPLISKGSVVSVEIIDMTNDGHGVGKINDRVIFVKDAILGEVVSAVVTKVKKNFLNGEVLETIVPSQFAIPKYEVCPHIADGCGGCNLGRLTYDAQLQLKSSRVKSALERIGGFNLSESSLVGEKFNNDFSKGVHTVFEEILPSPKVCGYRNKGVFSVEGTKVGFLKTKSRDVVDCPHCKIQMPEIMAAAQGIRNFLNIYPKESRYVQTAMIRAGDDGKVMVVITGQPEEISHLQELVDSIYEEADLVSLYGITIGSSEPSTEIGYGESSKKKGSKRECSSKTSSNKKKGEPVLLAGKPTLVKSIDGMKFEVGPDAFFQVNEEQISRLYGKAREYFTEGMSVLAGVEHAPNKTIADLYCGVGTIGLSMADDSNYILGIESNKEATLNANRNAVINRIVNARFFNGAAEDVLPELMGEGIKGYKIPHFDAVVLDPPRAGCDERLLSTIGTVKPGAIVYVSCDPATLSRDLGILCDEHGYRLVKVCPVDMFPGSMNAEAVALLIKLDEDEI